MKTAYGLPKKREEVSNILQAAFSEGNLDENEYEKRLDAVYEAKSMEDLKKVLADFPQHIQARLFPEVMSRPVTDSAPAPRQPYRSPREIVPIKVLMGDQHYPVPTLTTEDLYASNFLGTQKIDASHAVIQANQISIHVECLMGSTEINLHNPNLAGKQVDLYIHGALGEIKIFVPKGVQVTRSIQVFMGEFKFKKKNWNPINLFKSAPNVPEQDIVFTLHVHGSFFLGSVNIFQEKNKNPQNKWGGLMGM